MADLSDVTAFIAGLVAQAVYPNGTSQPSVGNMDCRIYEGWPISEQLDMDMAGTMVEAGTPTPVTRPDGPVVNVSIFPTGGVSATPYQILDNPDVIVPPVHGMECSIEGQTITISGQPGQGEFLTVVADQKYIFGTSGSTTQAILAAIATAAATNYSDVSATNTTLTFPSAAYLTARIGAPATLGNVTHRQRQTVMITVWAPTHVARSAFAKAIDAAMKEELVVTLPDTTQALIIYNSTNQIDDAQNQTIYRRDLNFQVEYATLETFEGVEITSVSVSDSFGQPFIS